MKLQDWEVLRQLKENILASVEMAYVFGNTLKTADHHGNSALLITKDDEVYGLGCNIGGRLGFSNSKLFYGQPTKLASLSRKGVTEFISGDTGNGVFVLARLRSGRLYWWGSIPHEVDPVYNPKEIAIDLKIRVETVACGGSYCAILSDDGKVFTWGQNNVGQLGHSENLTTNCKTGHLGTDRPGRVRGIIENERVIDISCGYDFSAVLLENGKVVTWGNNGNGELGINFKGGRSSFPVEVTSLRVYYEVVIEKITCGQKHVLALSESGILYAWGANHANQLAVRDVSVHKLGCPMEIVVDNLRVTDIGAFHHWNISVAQCENGKVYMWGETSMGCIWNPLGTKCESVDQVFLTYVKPKVMHRPIKLKNTRKRQMPMVETSNKKLAKTKMCIQVRTTYGAILSVSIDPTDTTERVKELIQEIEGIPVDQQRLICHGQFASQMDDRRTAQYYGLTDGCMIDLVLRLHGS